MSGFSIDSALIRELADLLEETGLGEIEVQEGERRLRIIDRRWSGTPGGTARTLEDMGATIEDLDLQGEYEMPTYRRSASSPGPAAPEAPLELPR